MWRYISLQIAFIAFATALAGELSIAPFGWEFRFGLGSSMFLFLLLLYRQVPYIKTGIITGVVVVMFRTLLNMIPSLEISEFISTLMIHLPAGAYYIAFAFGMSKISEKMFQKNLTYFGAIVVCIDVGANVVEIFIRYLLTNNIPIFSTDIFLTVVVAIIRVYFLIGLYANIRLSRLKELHKEQESRLDQMLTFGSNLYNENFYLSKMMNTIEQITASSYHLYRKLKDDRSDYDTQALEIAQQVHEIKKDTQRIRAGLNELYDSKTVREMDLTSILRHVIRGNSSYSEWLKKDITIKKEQLTKFKTSHYYPIISILNNLTANAVEAIDQKGTITIKVVEEDHFIYFTVRDNGKGIKEKDIPLIFEPGFTTKYSDMGTAATGIGLSHVKNICNFFSGEITIDINQEETLITIMLPTHLVKKEEL
ncbi:ATP-binding protein [Pseudogracilibacillus auburnensis]|uniref:histidine kinase n=1 Tax=Pseudogracilibacillus auburnensis TaxID=1494959 RepID=A0A2V3WGE7_9BACI|nr:ATP-binding protein [Pseudogracilibacillus auburnensis]MBO1002795.1 GHKL domain-containing protein [Pseudogracilibacillus auburnensis]PXW87909.1 two-component system sensor histidine kinase YcbA [Pseudogracilibacillus auburnensis]